jgi:SOS response regulatory protein OraA/RecX
MWKKWKEIKDDKDRIIKDVERARRKTFDRAVNLLAYKPRSVVELRTRLMEKEWTNSQIVEEVLIKLEGYGYLNDGQFAKDFAASQCAAKPIGKASFAAKTRDEKTRQGNNQCGD